MIIDLLLYGNNKDERIRAVCAHTGYLTFTFLIFTLTLRFILELVGIKAVGSVWVDFGILMFFTIFHLVIRGVLGVGMSDLSKKKKSLVGVYLKIGIFASAVSVLVAWLRIREFTPKSELLFPLSIAAVAGFAANIIISLFLRILANKIARHQNEKNLQEDDQAH